MRQIVIPVLVLVAGIACGGATETDVRTRHGPTVFDGMYAMFWLGDTSTGGTGPNPADGGTIEFPQADTSTMTLYVQDTNVGCGEVKPDTVPANISSLYVNVSRLGHGTLREGSYPLIGVAGEDVWEMPTVYYIELRGDCLGGVEVTEGHLSLSRVGSADAEGTLSIVLRDGTRIDGPFRAERCPTVWPVSPHDPTYATKRYCTP